MRPSTPGARDQILDAATRLMKVRGYHRTALDDILRESGTGKGNFYHHFRSKEELGFAILDRLFAEFTARTLDPVFTDPDRSPLEQVDALLEAILDAQRARNCVGGCPMGNLASELADLHEGFRTRLAAMFDGWRERVAGALTRARAAGALVPEADPDGLARFLVAGLEGGILLAKVQKDITVLERCVGELRRHLGHYCRPAAVPDPAASRRLRERGAVAIAEWTDERLQRDLLAQAPEAVEALVRLYGPKTYRLALRITGNPEDAREVSQDVLWAVVRKIGTFKGESALASWIYRITANAAYQKLRGRRGKEEVSWERLLPTFDADGHLVDGGVDWSQAIDDPALRVEARRRLVDAVESLPPDYRTVFVLHDMEGFANPEIAEMLGISLPAVKSRVHRSRLFLRHKLADYFGSRA